MTEVSIERLTKTFGTARAVDGISIRIADGEFISLLGPSGCGKTTTLKMIAGFEEASEGAIRFDGKDVVNVPAEKRDIGMVFQNYALFPHMTVDQNLAFGLEMRKIAKPEMRSRIAKVLDMVQLGGYSERFPNQLSGGQQQRVALARALVIEPKILLLDEPLANLDAKLREEMRVFIRDLQRRVGITTVYVTHDQAEAMTMSDRVVVMFGGRIAQIGAPSDIYERPENLEIAQFVGQVNLIKGTIIGAAEAGKRRVASVFGEVAVDSREDYAPGTAVTLSLRPEAIELRPEGQGGAAGKVTARYYSGSIIDYRVALDSGETLHVQTFPNIRIAEGDRVSVHAPADGFWLLGAAK
ncbi:ABC transporter ATP-binding protein [Mesorhizobium mediterraneum]|uniref:Spermidine/putrescine import ATP-binding protein PotA n=1 Tax=Mesorhizobium mediterraneum TaxID=43617 RepID=A0AB36RE06_9HYPH|nr:MULTISPECIES: ABC transporter ATP-binding protein [Mesorhizobium]PAQ03145.1 polyamine ABC transporter ATP-binding protein [Mesorhizobium mediterraneum]RUU47114.1 ABC transporter ATP-binding protein [Mesorhizobium sp. M6A.T.Ce.TU.002.03.1.1]RWN26971.1 MAG: ABC transporter ATP-binding protein [Mesorhizobium sp.]RWN45061.1 MAG: ABC transporter ATP-binding protein [Mesorhizobium sp.]WIW53250.1 ABC transporter ATP-binding protein [Mesorhizobium mediterraneum]